MWAFGCFAYELATGYPPFHTINQDQEALFTAIINKEAVRIPDKWSDAFADFVSNCLKKDRNLRWSFDQLLVRVFHFKLLKSNHYLFLKC